MFCFKTRLENKGVFKTLSKQTRKKQAEWGGGERKKVP